VPGQSLLEHWGMERGWVELSEMGLALQSDWVLVESEILNNMETNEYLLSMNNTKHSDNAISYRAC
jgi:hypothetical protein